MTVASVTQPSNGNVVIEEDGQVTYTPAADFVGSDSFTYVVNDGNEGSDSATVTLIVVSTTEVSIYLPLVINRNN